MRAKNGKIQIGIVAAMVALAAIVPLAQGASATGHPAHAKHGKAKAKHGKAKAKKADSRQRGTYWGAWIGTQLTGNQPPWDMSSVSAFSGLTGKNPSLLEFAAPFADCSTSPCNFYEFPSYEMQTIRNYGAIPFFSWGSQSTPVPDDLDEPSFQLADIANGTYDSYIREFAEGAREWGHPFFLRFDWEMNGNWFPWAENANGNQPDDYILAWRHVHDIFTQVGATNATWVWCPYVNATPKLGPLARYYPGDEYVDWTSLDGFNWANNGVNPQPWTSFDKIFGPSYRAIVNKLAPGKPMLLAEMASGGSNRAKATWIDQMFKQLRTKYRRIRGVIWFEQVDRGVEWPLESGPAATAAFSRGIRPSGFKDNDYSALEGAKILPPS